MKLPQAQSESLITRWIDGELIIIDDATHAVHCLSDPAARVFLQCTGKHTPEQIAAAESLPLEQVTDALEQLADAGLLLSAPSKLDLTRRAFTAKTVRASALAAASAPIITSLLLPAAAHASPLSCGHHDSASCEGISVRPTYAQAAAGAKAQADAACAKRASCSPTASCAGGVYETRSSPVYSGVTYHTVEYHSGRCTSPT